MSPPLLAVKDLRTHIATRAGVVKAVDSVSFEVREGEVLGIVGETGSGKSMTAASIMRLLPEAARTVGGQVLFAGQDLLALPEAEMHRLRGSQITLVVQNVRAALNPIMTIGRQMANVWRRHLGLDSRQSTGYSFEVLASVGFRDPARILRSYPHQVSGGMAQRVIIALAVGTRPRLVIADEPTTGLDATVQVEVLDLLVSKLEELGAAAIIITHDLAVVANYTQRLAVMHAGEVVEQSATATFFEGPLHPYALALTASLRPDVPTALEPFLAASDPVDLTSLPSGCRYQPRCPLAQAQCAVAVPMTEVAAGHLVRCNRVDAVREVTDQWRHYSR